jgi:cell division protein FtsI (penicillin-binding protein 3)
MSNIKRSILNRIFFSFSCVIAFSALVVWYIFNIQMVDGAKWRALSDSLTLKYKVIQAVRGNIYSHDGTLLATSVPRYEIRMDLTVLPQDTFRAYIPLLSAKFAEKFKDQSEVDYLLEFKKGRLEKNRYFLLKRKLSYLDIKEIKTWPLYKKGRFKSGLIIEEDNYRVMPFKNLLARTIGYTGSGVGKERVGIEGAYDSELAGITGRRLMQRIAGGYRPVNDNNEVEPIDGKDIYTTIDVNIQDIVNQALLTGLCKHNAHHGCVVVMDVKTGEIKAIANLTENGINNYKETFNYAFGESFEPGSTFKIISALALLEKEKIETNDSVLINYGQLKIGDKIMEDAESSPFKKQSFSYAFEHSSNVGISTSVMDGFKDNPKEFVDFIKELKLDKPLGLELSGEGKPFVKSPGTKTWSRISLPWMSIGYEIRLTPLQLLTVYNAVANDGEMVKPFIVKAIGQKGEIEKKFKTQIINDEIASESTIKKIKNLLCGVVDSGTAKGINTSRVKIAGKTGTARIAHGKGYSEGEYNSSFAGYFPAEKPKYSIIIVVNKPKVGGYFGGIVAAPIAKEIAEKLSGIHQNIGTSLSDTFADNNSLPITIVGKKSLTTNFLKKFTNYDYHSSGETGDWIIAKKDSIGEYDYVVYQDGSNLVPNLAGMGLRNAIEVAEAKNLKILASGYGRVYWQSISPRSKLVKGKTLLIKLKI